MSDVCSLFSPMRQSSRQFSDLRLHLRERGLAISFTQGQAFGIYDCSLAARRGK